MERTRDLEPESWNCLNAPPFWRSEPVTDQEQELWAEVIMAHGASAMRENASSVAVRICATGSGNYAQSLAGALMSIGGAHAPIELTMLLFMSKDPLAEAKKRLDRGLRVPGFGNSFVKGQPDPLWAGVNGIIEEHFQSHYDTLIGVTGLLHEAGKNIYPNPSAYTAITAIILKLPVQLAAYLFISGRIGAWTLIFGHVTGALQPRAPSDMS